MTLHEGQRKALYGEESLRPKVRVINAGRRWGKTTLAVKVANDSLGSVLYITKHPELIRDYGLGPGIVVSRTLIPGAYFDKIIVDDHPDIDFHSILMLQPSSVLIIGTGVEPKCDWAEYSEHPSSENPHLSHSVFDECRRHLPKEVFEREYLFSPQ